MIGAVLGYLIPLGFIFTGLWDGRDVVVIFWIESLIIFFYAMVRLALNPNSKFFGETFLWAGVCSVILFFIWAGFGEMLSDDLRIYSRGQYSNWKEMRTLLDYIYERNGSVAVLALFVVHGIEEVKCYSRSKGYRNFPKGISIGACKRFVTLLFFAYISGFAAVLFGFGADKSLPMVIAVVLVAVRIAMEFWFAPDESASGITFH